MTTSTVIASGVTTTAAGAGGALTGDVTGLDGLFAALMGGMDAAAATPLAGEATAPVGDGMISVLLGVRTGDAKAIDPNAATALGGLTTLFATQAPKLASEDVQLGDGPVLTVTGDAETLSAFVQHLKDVYQKVVVEGGLTIGKLSDSKELAGALTKLGMSEEEAIGVAERIQTMLQILEQQQDVDDKTAGSLVAMMLAVMGQQVPTAAEGEVAADDSQTFGLQIVSVEQGPAVATATTASMTSWQMRVSGDVTRDLLGLDGKAGVGAKLEGDKAETGEKTRKVEVSLTDGDASIAVAMPDVKAVAVPVHAQVNVPLADAQPSAAAQAANAVTTTGTAVRVAADERIEAPKGDTYYKLQADKNGVETLDAVKPMTELRDNTQVANQNVATGAAQGAAAAQAAAAGTDASFAERVAAVQDMVEKAGVGKQVAVQMQPLIDQGGGVVRINLNPKDLGQITVELTVQNGKVHGAIAASDPAIVEQLARELHSLRHGLADAGLKLGEQGINLMLSNGNHDGQQGQQGQNGHQAANAQARGGMTSDGTVEGQGELAANIAAWVAPDRVLDVNV